MDIDTILLILFIIIVSIWVMYLFKQDCKEKSIKESKYNVSKYPVISKMGNKYYAEIKYKYDSFWDDLIYCNVYTREIKENDKYKDKLIISERVNFESFNYNYIEVITHCIETYE